MEFPKISSSKLLHPTEKNVDMLEIFVKNNTDETQIILDPFMGSGSTGVACKQTNRDFIGIEIDETYFNIAEERIEKHTTQERLF
jgi:DNA modification methylase